MNLSRKIIVAGLLASVAACTKAPPPSIMSAPAPLTPVGSTVSTGITPGTLATGPGAPAGSH